MTREHNSGGVGSLRGSPHLGGSREALHFLHLILSRVGEHFVCFRNYVASASFSCWRFLWESTDAEEGEEPSWLTFLRTSRINEHGMELDASSSVLAGNLCGAA